jgi:hypothetical protein
MEPVTPWLGTDTAKHYQWYPFINIGHYELAKQLKDKRRDTIIQFYKKGIDSVWQKARTNAFYQGIPFIWCSNNLTVSFAIQCYWYRKLTNDKTYLQLEQACFDWIFGCNPWGKQHGVWLAFVGRYSCRSTFRIYPSEKLSYRWRFGGWALFIQASTVTLLVYNYTKKMNINSFKVHWLFIMMTMAITVLTNPLWTAPHH